MKALRSVLLLYPDDLRALQGIQLGLNAPHQPGARIGLLQAAVDDQRVVSECHVHISQPRLALHAQ